MSTQVLRMRMAVPATSILPFYATRLKVTLYVCGAEGTLGRILGTLPKEVPSTRGTVGGTG